MEDLELNWYVLFVMGGMETSICEYLTHQYEDWKVFFPKKEVIHKKQGEHITVQKPMFPSYIFIESIEKQAEIQRRIKEIKMLKQGIIKELRYEKELPALHEDERAYLTSLMDEHFVVKKSIGFIEDDHVMITEGPLLGYESSIVKVDRHKRNALLKVKILNRELEVSVSLEIVKKIG